ncbi:hypothetical protein EDD15DRAFT_2282339 [Pisolithus albus]|nr:hypothetical protein EDD15DRAFT_2282339 [Pisolithus albus]
MHIDPQTYHTDPLETRATTGSTSPQDEMKLKTPKGNYIGPLAVRDFLDVFLPCKEQLPDTTMVDSEKFRKVAEAESKSELFLSALKACSSAMIFKNADNKDNEVGAGTGEVPSACLYNEAHESDVDPSPLELCIVFQRSTAYDPFDDPNPSVMKASGSEDSISTFERYYSTRGNETKSAITSTALDELGTYFRTLVFSVLILEDEVRLIRWDRAGAVVTNRFNYVNDTRLLFEFFWRFAHLMHEEQGHRPSVRSLELRILSGGLGRVTRVSPDEEASVVLDLQAVRRRVKARKLYGSQIRGRFQCPPPVDLRGRDWDWEGIVGRQETTVVSKAFGNQQDNRDLEAGYKILLGPAGRILASSASLSEMMQGLLDACRGTSYAHLKAGLMHRNICPGNILLTEQGRGFLIGWDLCALTEESSEST